MTTTVLLFWPGIPISTIMRHFPCEQQDAIFYEKTRLYKLWRIKIHNQENAPSIAQCDWILRHSDFLIRICIEMPPNNPVPFLRRDLHPLLVTKEVPDAVRS